MPRAVSHRQFAMEESAPAGQAQVRVKSKRRRRKWAPEMRHWSGRLVCLLAALLASLALEERAIASPEESPSGAARQQDVSSNQKVNTNANTNTHASTNNNSASVTRATAAVVTQSPVMLSNSSMAAAEQLSSAMMSANSSKALAATRGGSKTNSRQTAATESSSPARQLKQQASRQQQQQQADNQMAADDAHETQAFMPGGQASRELERELKQAERVRVPAAKSANATPNWQTVSASVSAPATSWRPTGTTANMAHLPPPPPPVGYQTRPAQEQPGYSYGPGAYTHTTQMHARPRQFAASEQLARSSAPLEPVRVAPPRPAASPCRPAGAHEQQAQLLVGANELLAGSASSPAASGQPRYMRAGEGLRLRSQFVFKVLRADSLTECELACARAAQVAGNNQLDSCRSFNYRAYFAAENCELSRLELRALKLDDGAQFELHTQFDFYAQQAGATQLQQLQQLQPADCLDVSQSCSQDGMEFTLRTSEPFSGRIYTYGFYDSCFFDADGATTSQLRISRANGFPRCGTQQLADLMTNIVVVQFNDFVQTTRDKKYNLTCYFGGPAEAVVTSAYLDTKLDERAQPAQIEQLPPQNVVTSNVHLRVLYRGQPTNTLAVGDLLTFRLETGARQARGPDAPMSEIFATNVLAKDPYSGRQVQLIDARGCPVDPVNVFPELQRTPDGALESEFYAFKIPDSNFLIFQATVRTCKSPCEPVICHSAVSQLERPPVAAFQQQQQLASVAGLKGAGATLGAYLMAPHQSSAPSWGRRRKRDSEQQAAQDDELLGGAGESVEHVIPVRPGGGGAAGVQTRVRRPELAEAEEQVKEMFRVYLTRDEINKPPNRRSPAALPRELAHQAAELVRHDEPAEEQVCLATGGFHVLLSALLALSLLLLAVLLAALLLARRSKLRLTDTLADSMF